MMKWSRERVSKFAYITELVGSVAGVQSQGIYWEV
jgi:hypothetical protein